MILFFGCGDSASDGKELTRHPGYEYYIYVAAHFVLSRIHLYFCSKSIFDIDINH